MSNQAERNAHREAQQRLQEALNKELSQEFGMQIEVDVAKMGKSNQRNPVYRMSKLLSKVLRHDPGALNLDMDEHGWVRVDQFVTNARTHRRLVEEAVESNDKQRFEFDKTKERIRARQGHTIPVDVGLKAEVPPTFLYHGTYPKVIGLIQSKGLIKMARMHVHLSDNTETATAVGNRRGRAIIFRVEAGLMHKHGLEFFLSNNGVWLTNHVPPEYLELMG